MPGSAMIQSHYLRESTDRPDMAHNNALKLTSRADTVRACARPAGVRLAA